MFNHLRLDFYCDRNILSIIGLERKTENKRERERERERESLFVEVERESGREEKKEKWSGAKKDQRWKNTDCDIRSQS